MLVDFLLGVAASTVVGIVLWLVLPRGVVLTRQLRTSDWRGEPLADTWVLTNDSAVAATILGVEVINSAMYDDARERFAPQDLTDELADSSGVQMALDDQIDKVTRQEQGGGWTGLTVEPGGTIRVTVPNNTDVTVHYRRAGWSGLLERRHMHIRGGV